MSAESEAIAAGEDRRGGFPLAGLRGPLAIAGYTWREGIRKKTLIGFLLLSLLVIVGSTFITAFMANTTIGNVETDVETKIIKDICVSAISIFGILITIFISASVVPAEMDNKVIYTVLSKPVRRYQYLLGKFLGVQFIIIVNLVLMSVLFAIALYAKERIFPSLLFWSTLLTYFQFLIVSALTFAVSCTSTSSVLPTIAGLFIYVTGNLTEYIKDVASRTGESASFVQTIVGELAIGLYNILPNLRSFDMRNQILYLQPNDPPAEVLIPNLILYSLLFAVAGFGLSCLLFSRKEL
jgi:ABC-type transport system involved in multi-copper enzyme maturation permease subunit